MLFVHAQTLYYILRNHGIKRFLCVAVVMPKGDNGNKAVCRQKATTVIKGLKVMVVMLSRVFGSRQVEFGLVMWT